MTDGKVEAGDVYRTRVGDVFHDWQRGDRVVAEVIRGEDLHRYQGSVYWRRGSTAEKCALHGGRRQVFQVRD
jgi:hypothetical protein